MPGKTDTSSKPANPARVHIVREYDSEDDSIIGVYYKRPAATACARTRMDGIGGDWTIDAEDVPNYWVAVDDSETTITICAFEVES